MNSCSTPLLCARAIPASIRATAAVAQAETVAWSVSATPSARAAAGTLPPLFERAALDLIDQYQHYCSRCIDGWKDGQRGRDPVITGLIGESKSERRIAIIALETVLPGKGWAHVLPAHSNSCSIPSCLPTSSPLPTVGETVAAGVGKAPRHEIAGSEAAALAAGHLRRQSVLNRSTT
jgi:hypothetical protein